MIFFYTINYIIIIYMISNMDNSYASDSLSTLCSTPKHGDEFVNNQSKCN